MVAIHNSDDHLYLVYLDMHLDQYLSSWLLTPFFFKEMEGNQHSEALLLVSTCILCSAGCQLQVVEDTNWMVPVCTQPLVVSYQIIPIKIGIFKEILHMVL